MALPWVRLDVNISSHDKVLNLLSDPSARKWQAFSSYVCALGWAGGHGTDGRIPKSALPFVHGNETTARLLVKHSLWTEETAAWSIVNYDQRQEMHIVTEAKRVAQSLGGKKARCQQNHGKACGCWKEAN